MKSKTGLNFMVSVGRAIEQGGDNALAKLLQASQELVRTISIDPSYLVLKRLFIQVVGTYKCMLILYTNSNYAKPSHKKQFEEIEYLDKQRVSSLILLQGFANSDKSESNPNKQLSDERKLQNSIQDLVQSQDANVEETAQQILSPSAQSPLSVPTSPLSVSSSPASLNLSNPFSSLANRPFLTSPGLLPPGINPFFPHAGMMMPNPFQRFPGIDQLTYEHQFRLIIDL